MKRLGKAAKGTRAEVVMVHGESSVAARLSALGILPGRIVEVIHVAPLHDPITLRIDTQEISLRRADANLVEIRKI